MGSKTSITEAFRNKPWYPLSFILPAEKDAFLAKIRALGESRNNHWIAKPSEGCGGQGITVWKGSDPELTKLARESENSKLRHVAQMYLGDPLLIGGYKFHLRVHLVITSLDPLQAFVQENGQCLFATKPYTISSKTLGTSFDPPIHVTNMMLNATAANKDNFFRKKPIIGRGQQIRMRQLIKYLSGK